MNLTKKALQNTLWRFLAERPYSSVTVRGIVERAEMNRNTFYYHYRDLDDLLEQAFIDRFDELAKRYTESLPPLLWAAQLLRDLGDHRAALLNIYTSMPRADFLKLLDKLLNGLFALYAKTMPSGDIKVKERDVLLRSAKYLVTGMVLDWLENKMQFDPTEFAKSAGALPAEMLKLFPPEETKQAAKNQE